MHHIAANCLNTYTTIRFIAFLESVFLVQSEMCKSKLFLKASTLYNLNSKKREEISYISYSHGIISYQISAVSHNFDAYKNTLLIIYSTFYQHTKQLDSSYNNNNKQ